MLKYFASFALIGVLLGGLSVSGAARFSDDGLAVLQPRRLTENEHSVILAAKYNAKREVVLWDRTRVDLVTDEYVFEIDFAKKHYEAVGQSLWYAIVTDKKPAIILLAVPRDDDRFVYRCQAVCAKHGIKLFVEKVRFR